MKRKKKVTTKIYQNVAQIQRKHTDQIHLEITYDSQWKKSQIK